MLAKDICSLDWL